MKFRHIGIPVIDLRTSKQYYEKMGFTAFDTNHVIIDGTLVEWIKMRDSQCIVIELIKNAVAHIAVTVDRVDRNRYYSVAPTGHKIQYEHAPDGMLIEKVEEPK